MRFHKINEDNWKKIRVEMSDKIVVKVEKTVSLKLFSFLMVREKSFFIKIINSRYRQQSMKMKISFEMKMSFEIKNLNIFRKRMNKLYMK